MVWFWLDDSPDKAKWLTKEDKKCLQEMMDNDRLTPGSARGSHQPPRHATTQHVAGDFTPVVMMYTLAYFCLTNTLSAISIWTPQILQSFNQGSSITIGLLAAVPQICTILGWLDWSRHSDRRQERRHHTALPYSFAAAGWLLASELLSQHDPDAGDVLWLRPDHSAQWRFSGQHRISPSSLRARAIGIAVINATGNIGSALSPFMIGWLVFPTGSFSSGLWFVAALLVIGAGIIWAIPMQSSRPRATP